MWICYLFCVLLVSVSCEGNYIESIQNFTQKLFDAKTYDDVDDSELCQKHLEQMPIQMIDASSKLQSGILAGNLVDLGHYDQCVAIRHRVSDEDTIRGQYCSFKFMANPEDFIDLIDLEDETDVRRLSIASARVQNVQRNDSEESSAAPLQLQLGFSLCLPHSCSAEDLLDGIEDILDQNNLPIRNVTVSCQIDEKDDFSSSEYFAIVVFVIFGLLLLLSTGYEVVFRYQELPIDPNSLWISFSIYKNGNRLLAVTQPTPGGDNISCIHGLRAISILWVLLGHRFFMTLGAPVINKMAFYTWTHEYHSTLITGATVSVDTFFVMSGLLLSYISLKVMDKEDTFKLVPFYIHRYVRLTPAFAAMILLDATFLHRLGDGPLWDQTMKASKGSCEDYWWSALLYVQNYVNPKANCVAQSWYLSVDMQLFILSPLVLIPLWKWPRHAVKAIGILLLASIAILVGITVANEYPVGLFEAEGIGEVFTNVYIPTHTRFGPWLAGILTGYFLHETRNDTIFINKKVVAGIWVCVATVMLAVVIGVYPFYLMDEQRSVAENVLYLSFSRISWGICICWIIFACKHAYGGPVNWILSWGIWQPISRLSYCLYITHFAIQLMLTSSRRTAGYFSDTQIVYEFFGDLCFALFASAVWSLTFESPILIIEKFILNIPKMIITIDKGPHVQPDEEGYVNSGFANNQRT